MIFFIGIHQAIQDSELSRRCKIPSDSILVVKENKTVKGA